MLRYRPNPAHKTETSEVGPPAWIPNKEKCPKMDVRERNLLLQKSIPTDPTNPISRRYAMRRIGKETEFFEAKVTRQDGSGIEFHGHPTSYVPPRILAQWRDKGFLTKAEYRALITALA